MRRRCASLARTTLLLATALPCAWAQTATQQNAPATAKPVQINRPTAKPVQSAQPIPLGTTVKPAETVQPTEIIEEPPLPPEAPVKSFAPAPVFDAALDKQIRAMINGSHGKVALYAWQLNTSRAVAIDADRTVQTEDVVELAMLWETLRQIALGNTHWDDTLASTTVRDATVRMVTADDAAMPALLAEHFTHKRVEQDLTTFGYNGEWLDKNPSKRNGAPIPDRTTPRQMVRLLQHIGMCDLDLPKQLHINTNRADAACSTAVNLMRKHLYRGSMSAIAGSGGSSQVAILPAETGPIVVAIYAYDAPAASDLSSAVTTAIVNAWSPQGLDSALIDKPHLGVSWE